jgi:hypothetical protein
LQKKIAQVPGIHHETVKRILRDNLSMRKMNFKCVPHAMNSSHKGISVQVSRELLDFLESCTDPSLSNRYVGDEPWVYFDIPRTSM